MIKDKVITLRMSKETLDQLQALADAEERSRNQTVERLIRASYEKLIHEPRQL